MRGIFRNVAQRTRLELDAPPPDAQAAGAFNDVTNNVFVGVPDLLCLRNWGVPEGNQSAGEVFGLKTGGVANFIIKFLQTFEKSANPYNFHGK